MSSPGPDAADRPATTSPDRGPSVPAEAITALLDGLPFGIAIHDADLRCVSVNDALCEMGGFGPAGIVGRRLADLLPGVAASLEPLMRRALDRGERSETEIDATISPRIARQRFATTVYPLDDRGELVATVVREITDERFERDILSELRSTAIALAGATSLDQVGERIEDGAGVVPDTIVAHVTSTDPETEQIRVLRRRSGTREWSDAQHHDGPLLRPYVEGGWTTWTRAELREEFGELPWLHARTTHLHAGPLRRGGGCLGTIAWELDRPHGGDSVEPISRIYASTVEAALASAERTELDRRLARAHQQALLPHRVEQTEGLSLAADYRSAMDPDRAGGDWYDVVSRRDGATVLIVGDVVGHGIDATVAMGQARAITRSAALELVTPAEMLDRAERHLGTLPDRPMVAITIAVIAPGNCRLTVSVAAQPGPFHCAADGTVAPLAVRPSPFLGSGYDIPDRHELEVDLRPGDTVVLFSDGLVEDRRGDVDRSLDAVRRIVPEAGDDLDATVQRLIRTVAPPAGDDDVVVLAARRDL